MGNSNHMRQMKRPRGGNDKDKGGGDPPRQIDLLSLPRPKRVVRGIDLSAKTGVHKSRLQENTGLVFQQANLLCTPTTSSCRPQPHDHDLESGTHTRNLRPPDGEASSSADMHSAVKYHMIARNKYKKQQHSTRNTAQRQLPVIFSAGRGASSFTE